MPATRNTNAPVGVRLPIRVIARLALDAETRGEPWDVQHIAAEIIAKHYGADYIPPTHRDRDDDADVDPAEKRERAQLRRAVTKRDRRAVLVTEMAAARAAITAAITAAKSPAKS